MDIGVVQVASRGGMGKVTVALVIVIVLLLLGGMAFLAFWNPPPPLRARREGDPRCALPKVTG